MKIERVEKNSTYWNELIQYTRNCSWIAGEHIANMLEKDVFTEWESIFVVIIDERIVGYCTFMKTDYYPDNKYFPWVSSIFVEEDYRGKHISQELIETIIEYAKKCGFSKVYIPSNMKKFYEKYGFIKVDELMNYGGDIDNIFMKDI